MNAHVASALSMREKEQVEAAIAQNWAIPLPIRATRGQSIDVRREIERMLTAQNWPLSAIAKALGVSYQTALNDFKAMKVAPVKQNRTREPGEETLSAKKARRAIVKAAKVVDRRRFKTVPVPMGDYSKIAAADAKGTMFPTRVFIADGKEMVLKDGASNSKIGGDVLVGRLKGAYIVTLTLEERATCPTTCRHWAGCYGNGMQYARRWQGGAALEAQLRVEVAEACAANDLVLIRLHVLGDFYSFDYVALWAELLDTHDNLNIFGFTAWDVGTDIGDAISKLRKAYPQRFMIRTSGRTGRWGSFTVDFPTEQKMIGDAIVCPEQLDGMRGSKDNVHCGSCAVCWSCDRPIAFIVH